MHTDWWPAPPLVYHVWMTPHTQQTTESLRLGNTALKSLIPTIPPALPIPPLTPVPKCHIHMAFKSLHYFPGQPFPVLDKHFCEDFSPISNLNLSWSTLKQFPLVPCYLGEKPYLATTSFQGIAKSNKVSSEPPFIQTTQPQLPQQEVKESCEILTAWKYKESMKTREFLRRISFWEWFLRH